MNNDLLFLYLEQAAVVITFTLFSVFFINPLRLSQKKTGMISTVVIFLSVMPRLLFPKYLVPDPSATSGQIIIQIIYWGLCIAIQSLLLFVLTRRQWLRVLFLYAVWDAFLSLMLVILSLLVHFVHMDQIITGTSLMPFFLIMASALIGIAALRHPFQKLTVLPRSLCLSIVVIYTVIRYLNTILYFHIDTTATRQTILYTTLGLALFIVLVFTCIYITFKLYVTKRVLFWKYSCTSDILSDCIETVLTKMTALCSSHNVIIQTNSAVTKSPYHESPETAYMIELLFRLLLDLIIHPDMPCGNTIFFTAQEQKGYLILSALGLSVMPEFLRKKETLLSSLRCSLLEIALESLLRRNEGQIRYLDSNKKGIHLQVILPLGNFAMKKM